MQGKWDLRKTVLLLAEDPAQGIFENSRDPSLPAAAGPDQELAPVTQRAVSFTELKLPSSPQNTAPVFHPDLVIRKGDLILEIANSASDELLSWIGGLLDAE